MSLTVSASGITFDDLTTLSSSVISAANIADRTITSNKIATGVSIVGSLSGVASQATTLVTASASNAPVYGCRAWVNFDGTRNASGGSDTANTNRFIRSSGNVSSVLRNGTGDYTVNFATAMADANYSAIAGSYLSGIIIISLQIYSKTTTSFRVLSYGDATGATNGFAADMTDISVQVFGN